MWDKLTDLIKTERPITLIALGIMALSLMNLTDSIKDLRESQWTFEEGNRLATRQERFLRKYFGKANAPISDEDYWPNPLDVRISK